MEVNEIVVLNSELDSNEWIPPGMGRISISVSSIEKLSQTNPFIHLVSYRLNWNSI